MNKTTKILLIVLCVVCLLVAGFSAYKLISILNEYKAAVNSYEDMSSSYVSTDTPLTQQPEETESDETEEVCNREFHRGWWNRSLLTSSASLRSAPSPDRGRRLRTDFLCALL